MTQDPELDPEAADEARRQKWTRMIPRGCLASVIVLALVFFFIVSICSRA